MCTYLEEKKIGRVFLPRSRSFSYLPENHLGGLNTSDYLRYLKYDVFSPLAAIFIRFPIDKIISVPRPVAGFGVFPLRKAYIIYNVA